jgi:hypothetical protein
MQNILKMIAVTFLLISCARQEAPPCPSCPPVPPGPSNPPAPGVFRALTANIRVDGEVFKGAKVSVEDAKRDIQEALSVLESD